MNCARPTRTSAPPAPRSSPGSRSPACSASPARRCSSCSPAARSVGAPGANASYTIFQAGAGHANVRLTEAQQRAARATYQGAIQTAFRDVADALARRGTINDEIAARQRQQAATARHLSADRSALQCGNRSVPDRARRAAVLLCGAADAGVDQAHRGAEHRRDLSGDRRRSLLEGTPICQRLPGDSGQPNAVLSSECLPA